jgi:glycosyltransferase involved in cell wall biosynthesis
MTTQPLRITFIIPPLDRSGGQRVIAIYAARLQRRGHQVTVVAVAPKRRSLRAVLASWVKNRPLPCYDPYQRSHFDGSPVRLLRLRHPAPVTDNDVPDGDVVIATWWETASWVGQLGRSKGGKVHFVQGYETWGGPLTDVEAVYASPIPKIVVSRWLEQQLVVKHQKKPLALVPNSVETERFYAPPRGRQNVPTVGLLYSPAWIKGSDIALKACELASRQIANLRVRVAGNVPIAPSLPLPPAADFTLRASDDQLRAIYSSCAAWLFASRCEGFGLPILEAMACRTPVIATPAGAAPELLSAGGGILVPPEDPQAMAEAIKQVCSLPEARWRALANAAAAIATRFTWDHATDEFEAALRRISRGESSTDIDCGTATLAGKA